MLLACKLVKCPVTGAWILQAVVVLACNLYMPVFQHAICMQPCDFFAVSVVNILHLIYVGAIYVWGGTGGIMSDS